MSGAREFRVKCYRGADRPLGEYLPTWADSAKEAAEQACGEELIENGKPGHLRAVVNTMPPRRHPWTFYTPPLG